MTSTNKLNIITNATRPVAAGLAEIESQRDFLLKKIKNLKDTFSAEESCFYIASDGSPENDGRTPQSPWDSLETLNKNADKLSEGDIVLLRRGDIFRGFIDSKKGISYGAYGEGDKPKIYGSDYNHIIDKWYIAENGLWTADVTFPADVGNIIFDDGLMVGVKKNNLADIKNNYDFWSDPNDGNRIYIRLEQNPIECFKSIEVAFNLWMFRISPEASGVTIENISFSYCGGHALRAWCVSDITVRGCEFYFIGGCFLTGYKDGTVRYGNAIEFMCGCKNILVENCFANQIYDSGITHQGYGDYCAENILFRENLLEYCGMGSIEYWLGAQSLCRNVLYSDNIMRYAGYGFGGMQRPDKNMSAHIQSNGACLNEAENFRIENNIFELSTFDIINAQSRKNTLPKLKGNTYIQVDMGRLGSYAEYIDCIFTPETANTVEKLWGDSCAKVFCTEI